MAWTGVALWVFVRQRLAGRKRWVWGIDVSLLSLGIAVVALIVSLFGERLPFNLLFLVVGFFLARSIKRTPRVETESEWRHELLAVDDSLKPLTECLAPAFKCFVNSDHCKTREHNEINDDWEEMFSQAKWPGGEESPLHHWESHFYGDSSVYTKTVHDFAVATFTTNDIPGKDYLDEWRRRTARTLDVWGERLLHHVPGFQEFLERYDVKQTRRLFIQVLAYLEIGRARAFPSQRPPVRYGIWDLGRRWSKT